MSLKKIKMVLGVSIFTFLSQKAICLEAKSKTIDELITSVNKLDDERKNLNAKITTSEGAIEALSATLKKECGANYKDFVGDNFNAEKYKGKCNPELYSPVVQQIARLKSDKEKSLKEISDNTKHYRALLKEGKKLSPEENSKLLLAADFLTDLRLDNYRQENRIALMQVQIDNKVKELKDSEMAMILNKQATLLLNSDLLCKATRDRCGGEVASKQISESEVKKQITLPALREVAAVAQKRAEKEKADKAAQAPAAK